jgi:hypothetical protein
VSGGRARRLGLLLAWSSAVVRPGTVRPLDVAEALARERRRHREKIADRL